MGILLMVAGVLLVVAGIAFPQEIDGQHYRRLKGGLAAGGVALLLIGIPLASYVGIPAGHRGVLLQFGAVKGVLSEGAHFIMPVMQGVERMEVRTQRSDAKAQAASKDLQIVHTDVAINFHLDPAQVGALYKTVGIGYDARVIQPAVQETLKAVVSRYTAEELIRNREQVKASVDTSLTQRLAVYNIAVEPGGVSLTNFDFSDEFNKAIEQKQVAQQESEKQRYVLSKAKMEAETAIAKAKGEAESHRVRAAALNSQGGAKVLAREWIEKWDGKLPVVGSSGGNIVDVRSLMTKE